MIFNRPSGKKNNCIAYSVIVLLVSAVLPLPYIYYKLLGIHSFGIRWILLFASLYFFAHFLHINDKYLERWLKIFFAISFPIIAVLFNPFKPFHFNKILWSYIDVFSAVIFSISIFPLKEMQENYSVIKLFSCLEEHAHLEKIHVPIFVAGFIILSLFIQIILPVSFNTYFHQETLISILIYISLRGLIVIYLLTVLFVINYFYLRRKLINNIKNKIYLEQNELFHTLCRDLYSLKDINDIKNWEYNNTYWLKKLKESQYDEIIKLIDTKRKQLSAIN